MEVRGAIVYATMIEVVAVTPIILLPGLSGSFFRPLAVSYWVAEGCLDRLTQETARRRLRLPPSSV